MLNDTIAAISTGKDLSAVSIIRMSGDEVFTIINQLFTKKLDTVPSHTIHYGYIKNPLNGELVDEVLDMIVYLEDQVAAGKIEKELLHDIMTAILDGTYENDEELKLRIYKAISEDGNYDEQ